MRAIVAFVGGGCRIAAKVLRRPATGIVAGRGCVARTTAAATTPAPAPPTATATAALTPFVPHLTTGRCVARCCIRVLHRDVVVHGGLTRGLTRGLFAWRVFTLPLFTGRLLAPRRAGALSAALRRALVAARAVAVAVPVTAVIAITVAVASVATAVAAVTARAVGRTRVA